MLRKTKLTLFFSTIFTPFAITFTMPKSLGMDELVFLQILTGWAMGAMSVGFSMMTNQIHDYKKTIRLAMGTLSFAVMMHVVFKHDNPFKDNVVVFLTAYLSIALMLFVPIKWQEKIETWRFKPTHPPNSQEDTK